MQVHEIVIDGDRCRVLGASSLAERDEVVDALESLQGVVAVDVEANGLDIFSPSHRLLSIQFSDRDTALVLPTAVFDDVARAFLRSGRRFVAHNATFDLLAIDQHLGVKVEELVSSTFDTKILAHLIDPRSEVEGGTGHGLKRLAEVWVDPSSPDSQDALKTRFRELKANLTTGWDVIDASDPVLVKYAGVDALLTRRLFDVLKDQVKALGLSDLATFEHHLQGILATVQRRGILLDRGYTVRLREELAAEAVQHADVAFGYGVTSVSSPKQVADALVAMGESLSERTAGGALKVDKAVLLSLADLDRSWERVGAREPNPLAEAVLRSKQAAKWGSAYAETFLELADVDGRVHPWISSLQARTGRMAVSRPPLQQLPSSDWRVRRCFVADPGNVMVSVDYSQVEVRVLAALAEERYLSEAIASGEDLHSLTAARIFGEGFSKRQRTLAKIALFSAVYGGGAAVIQKQTGADEAQVRETLRGLNMAYPGIKRYARGLQMSAERGRCEIVTPSGRVLPLDRDRTYAALNAVVQSTARDILAQAIVDLHAAGLTDFMLMPIHDEVLAQAPVDEAEGVALAIRETMETTFRGVEIVADAEVGGRSWGSLYGSEV